MQHYSCGGSGGGSGLHRKKLEEKDDEIWTMGRRESWLGRGPSTVLVRDFAAKMKMFLLRSITQRGRGQVEVTAYGKIKSSGGPFHLDKRTKIIQQDAEHANVFYQTPATGGSVAPRWSLHE